MSEAARLHPEPSHPEAPLLLRAHELDAADPLAAYRDEFLHAPGSDVVAYLDGNSLGRPLAAVADRMQDFIGREWAGRLIRGWGEGDGEADDAAETEMPGGWMEWPQRLGDRIGAAALGAGTGQVAVADSTTVLLYKLARAAVDLRPDRREIVLDSDNFPTDRYVMEGIAAERGLDLVWIEPDITTGVTTAQVSAACSERTALVVLSHVAYRSGWVADAAAITRIAHDVGALVLWDLSHSVGSVEVYLDEWEADFATGCGYKYLNGGPGAPAFGYVRRDLQAAARQPIWGWIGRADTFAMGPGYLPANGIRSLLSGTPPVVAMVPLAVALEQLERAGIVAVRAKSVALTAYALELVDAWLVPLGVEVISPRDPAARGGHLTIQRRGLEDLLPELWRRGVIPDYRAPDGLRLGLAPLSTSFSEVYAGLSVLRDLLGSR